MGGSSKSQTVGYRYYLGMHLAICHGPVDAITEIQVGERQAWSGNLTASGRITVNVPELFGGEKREGGISGAIDAAFGQAAQTPNDYLASKIGSPQPAYRGVLSLILRQLYIAANNPYGVWQTKIGLNAALDAPSLRHAKELENRIQIMAGFTKNMQEASAALLEKRPAVWEPM